MNVIEKVRTLLSESTLLDDFNGVHIDYREAHEGEAGLYPMGAFQLGEDIVGNQKWSIPFELHTDLRASTDYDRISNSNFMLELGYFLSKQKYIPITEVVNGVEYPAIITKMSCSNAMTYSLPTGDIYDGMMYMLQISVEYTIYTEEY